MWLGKKNKPKLYWFIIKGKWIDKKLSLIISWNLKLAKSLNKWILK